METFYLLSFHRFAEIVNDYESSENRNAKCMNVIIYRDKNSPNCYQKFSYDLTINYLNSTKESIMDKTNKMLHDLDKFMVADNFIDDYFMEFRFEIKLHEYDLTGAEIKSMNSIEYKMNLLKDLDELLDSGISSDMEIKVDGTRFKVHKTIMARSPDLTNNLVDIDDKLFGKYLKFVYTGEFGGIMKKEELESMKIFAENIKFDTLESVCAEMLKNIK